MLQNLEHISPLTKEILDFLTRISENDHVERIIVFGSRALGDYETYSDLDLAVDAPNITKYEWLKLREFATYDLKSLIRISLVHYSTNPHKLRERINHTGKIIYARQSQTFRQPC
jgi:predicted nucleotidyltransferase